MTSMRVQLAYMKSFVMFTIANALGCAVELSTIFLFFGRFGGFPGWTVGEVAMFYGMTSTAYALCEAWMRGMDIFHRSVRTGDFDRVLLRPRGTVLQLMGSELQLLRLGRLSVGLFALIWGASGLPAPITAGGWLLIALSILGGTLLFSGIIFMQATMAFWTVEPMEVWNVITYGGVEVTQYPLTIYGARLRGFFSRVVPLAAVNYWPLSLILGRGGGSIAWLSPLMGVAWYALGLVIWRFGVRHYRSTGS